MPPEFVSKLLEQAPIVIFMAICLYLAWKFIAKMLDRQESNSIGRYFSGKWGVSYSDIPLNLELFFV